MNYRIKRDEMTDDALLNELDSLRRRVAGLEAAGTKDSELEESLKESEELYKHLFENIPTGVYRTTPDGRILMANSALVGMLGYSSFEELSSINLEEGGYQTTSLRSQFKELLEREGEVRGLESKWTRCDGTEIFVRENARAIRGRDGAVMYYEGTVEDITERKQAEDALRESLAQLSKKNRYETIISTVTRSIHQSIDLQEVLNNAVESMSRNIASIQFVSIYLIEGEEAILRAYSGYPDSYVERAGRIPYSKGATWKTLTEGTPRYVPDVDHDTFLGPAGREAGIMSYVSMPIRSEGRTAGTLNITSSVKNAFDEEELKLLETVANRIETAINNAQQAEALRQSEDRYRKAKDTLEIRVKDLEILTSLIRAVNSSPSLEETYRVALDSVVMLENVDMAAIYLIDEEKREAVLQAHRNFPEDYLRRAGRIPYPKGITWKVINTGRMLNVENAQKDPDIGPAGKDLGHNGILGIPIALEEKIIGVIWFVSYKERKFNEKEVNLLSALGDQIAIAIARTKMFEEIKQREEALSESFVQLSKKNRYETIISTVTRSVHQSINLQDVLENAVETMSKNIDVVEHVAIHLVEGEEAAVIKAYRGHPDWFVERVKRIPYPKGFTWKTIIDGKPRYCPDVDQDTFIGPAGREVGTKSYLSMPIYYEGKTVGCINVHSFHKNAFDEEEIKLLNIVAQQIETAINNAKQTEALQESEERYRALYENNPSMYFTIDAEGKVLSVNRFGIEQLGYTAEELIGESVLNVFYEDDKKAILEQLSRCLQNPGQIFQWELRKIRKDGGILWVRETARAVRRTDGNIVVFIVCDDITEKKWAEVALRDSLDQLSKKNRYDSIINAVTQSVHKSIDLQEVMQNAVDAMSKNINKVDHVSIFMVEGREAVLKAYRGYNERFIERVRRIPKPLGFTWNTIIIGKPMYCRDAELDTIIGPAGKEIGTKSYASVPIRFGEEAVGCISVNSLEKDAFDDEELKLLGIVSQQIELAINNAKQAQALHHAKEQLELRVRERTRELADMNVELRKEIDWRMRIEKALRGRTEKIIQHQKVLLKIARMDNSDLDSVLRKITEADAKTLGTERVSVWFFNEDRSAIICKDLYKASASNHESGLRFRVKDHPTYFQALEESRILGSNDAWTDARTREFAEGYLKPLGITSMMDVPIRLHGNVVGVVCHEHVGVVREWTAEEQDFVASIADMVSLAIEASERGRAEEQVRASLKEKEVLLKEIHHRVKNNLQIIHSMLNLQSRYIDDTRTSEKLKESRNRVKTMALIHEALYRSKDLARVDFGEYIKKISTLLLRSYMANSKQIRMDIDVDNVFMSVDKAIPCGLIINEIVSNSIKHAFPVKKKGRINISLRCVKNRPPKSSGKGRQLTENRFELVVGNDGVEFPKDLDFQNSKSLGLQLICALADQLNGRVELDTRGGAEFKISFPA